MSRATEQAGRGHAIEARRFQATLILVRAGFAFTLLGLLLGATIAAMTTGPDDRRLAMGYARDQATAHLRAILPLPFNAQRRPQLAVTGFETPGHAAATRLAWCMGLAGGSLAILLGGGMTMLMRQHWIRTAQEAALDQVLRGSRIATAQELAALVAPGKPQGQPLRIGGVPIPPQDEARHMLFVGRSGSGKTTALHALLRQIAQRGEHVLIFDPDGSYTQHFYQPARGDVILNPWDARSARWNPLADVASLADAYRVAAILLPKPTNLSESGVWYDQARAVVAHITDHLAGRGAGLDELATMLSCASADRLRAIMTGTPAARVFEAGGERATASVLFMMSIAARTVAMLAAVPDDAPAFSFDRFYSQLDARDGPKPMIFLAAPRRYREAGAPVIAAWVDAAASAILQRTPDQGGQVWLFLDELASLPPIQSLLTLLPEGRKYRAGTVIAFQSIAQLRQTYGQEGAEIVSGQTATQLLMAVGDHATARWAVELAGTVEVENQRPSEQFGEDRKAHGSLATTRERKSLILDAELTSLHTGEAYLRLSGYPIAKVTITPGAPMPVIAPAFLPAPTPPRVAADEGGAPPLPRIEDREDWLDLGGL